MTSPANQNEAKCKQTLPLAWDRPFEFVGGGGEFLFFDGFVYIFVSLFVQRH